MHLMDSILLKNISLPEPSGGLRQADITIGDGRITGILPPSSGHVAGEGCEVVDCTGKVALPGFVNMHTHAAMSLMRGVGEDMMLGDWLDHIWKIESRLDGGFVFNGTRVAALEMVKTGTTAMNDMYWYPEDAWRAVHGMGLSGAVSYVLLDGMDPVQAKVQRDACMAFFEKMAGVPGVRPMLSVHTVYTVLEEQILWGFDYARKHGLRVHIHLCETRKEVEDCRKAHGGLSPVEYLDSLGLLGPDVVAAHSLWLSDNDIEILGRNHVNCVHNINSNLKLASGYMFRWKELSEAGANVCLGTDGCASSNNLDMLEAMKTTALLQKAWRKDPSALPLHDLLDMATVNGARALGIDSGAIEVGKAADIQIIDTDSTFFLSPGPFLANFIYSAHSDCISSVIAGGKFVMRDRKVEGEEEILRQARKVLDRIK